MGHVPGVETLTTYAQPVRMSKLPYTLDGRTGSGTRVFSFPMWTDETTNQQYAVFASMVAIAAPATPTVLNSNSGQVAGGASIIVAKTTSIPEGALLVATIAVAGATVASTITPPTVNGWVLRGFSVNSANVGLWVYTKVWTSFSGTPNNWTFVRSDTANAAAWTLDVFGGAKLSEVTFGPTAAVIGTGTAIAVPAVTTLDANSILLSVVASAAINSVTTDAAYVERTDVGAAAPSLSSATVAQAAIAASTAATHTLATSAAYAAVQIAISPRPIESRPLISVRTLPDGDWSTPFDLSTIAANPLVSPVDQDEHNMFAVARAGDGRVYVIGNSHFETGALRMVRTQATDGTISGTWEATAPTNLTGIIFPEFIKVTNGDLLLISQDQQVAATKATMKVARLVASTGVWDAAITLITGLTASPVVEPFFSPVPQDPANLNKIGIFFGWKLSGAVSEKLSYFESVNGGVSWQTPNGTALTLPVRHPTDPAYSTTTNPNAAELIDAATDIRYQEGACYSTSGVPQIVYQKTNAGALMRLFHAYRSGGVWTIRELPAFTAKTRRGRLFPAPGGRVFYIVTIVDSGLRDGVQVVEVTPSVTLFRPERIATWTLGNSEVPIDARAALFGQLHVLVTGSATQFGTEQEQGDDINWHTQTGYVMTVPGSRMWEVQRNQFGKLGVEKVDAVPLPPLRVTQTVRAIVGVPMILDETWIGPLMVRLRAKGSVMNNNGVMGLYITETPDGGATTKVGLLMFTSTVVDGHETPWIPLSLAGGEGQVQVHAVIQPTMPTIQSGGFLGDPGYGDIVSGVVELGRVLA